VRFDFLQWSMGVYFNITNLKTTNNNVYT